jgi:hypothetical protein
MPAKFFGEMYGSDVWNSICEDTEIFTDQMYALEVIYVDTLKGRCKLGKRN